MTLIKTSTSDGSGSDATAPDRAKGRQRTRPPSPPRETTLDPSRKLCKRACHAGTQRAPEGALGR
eukprot:5146039-Prymnesium_polylepis.1